MHIGYHPVDMIPVFLKLFIAELVMNDQVDDEGGAEADGKAGNVDDGENFISPEISKCNYQIVFKHRKTLSLELQAISEKRTAHIAQLCYYSVLSDFTGLAIAALIAVYPTVNHAIHNEQKIVATKNQTPIVMR